MDCFELCAFKTPAEGASDALRAILDAGMPANVRVCDLRTEVSEFEPQMGLLHIVCTYANPENSQLAADFVDTLLEYGATWNLLDGNNQTPGDIAYARKNSQLYDRLVRAGVTSEIILQKFLEDGEADDEMTVEGSQSLYLQSELTYDEHTLQTNEQDRVMMDWETPIMRRSAELVTKKGGTVLNIGFGMGIIDTFIQELEPASHYIIEAHPDVLKKMKQNGWYEKKGVHILEGTWKQLLGLLLDEGVLFDGIYYDTFSEHYKDMLLLFDRIVGLLAFDGIFSYFNGLGADRQVCYDVYKQVAVFNLKDYSLQVEWEEMPVEIPTYEGLKRGYFRLDRYSLPIITFGAELSEEEGDLA